ncbi:MAG: mechanosensitive ion channel domain-containing protein [Halieaceae bacterium]|jgi:small-conductance mechanosensitive channel|nr:mechanosensitive ion channel domain-containing protein [Halieaceae bacterium]
MLQTAWDGLVSLDTRYLIALGTLLAWLLIDRVTKTFVEQRADDSRLRERETKTAVRTFRAITLLVSGSIIALAIGIDFRGLLLLGTSVLTLTGVALFANWSVLSNITSFFILLVQSDIKRGNFVRVVEADNYLEGYIAHIGTFHTRLITEDRQTILLPNNLMLARAVMVNPRTRLSGMGKLSPPAPPVQTSDE